MVNINIYRGDIYIMKYYKYILYILLLVKINTLANGDIWFQQESNTTKSLNDVFFINADTGWIAGQDGTILHTTNGGDQWNLQTSGTDEFLYSVHFVNSKVGYIAGWNGTILKTEDSGNNWTSQTSGTDRNFLSVWFIHPDTGWISSEGFIKKTVNGGVFWSTQSIPISQPIFAIQFIDNNNGWAVGTGNVLNTTDGGENWNIIPTGVPTVDWWDLCCIDEDHIWIGSHNDGVYNTTNGGIRWYYKGEGTYLYFITNDVGWTSYGHTIYSTVDCGSHWESYTFDFYSPLFIYFVTTKIGWVIGEEGRIFKTTTGGVVTNIEDKYNMNKPEGFMLLQNYPNPFNPVTEIRYNLPRNCDVLLDIWNIRGQKVATIVDEQQTAGYKVADWDAGSFSSGIYFYRLRTDYFVKTKRMFLMK